MCLIDMADKIREVGGVDIFHEVHKLTALFNINKAEFKEILQKVGCPKLTNITVGEKGRFGSFVAPLIDLLERWEYLLAAAKQMGKRHPEEKDRPAKKRKLTKDADAATSIATSTATPMRKSTRSTRYCKPMGCDIYAERVDVAETARWKRLQADVEVGGINTNLQPDPPLSLDPDDEEFCKIRKGKRWKWIQDFLSTPSKKHWCQVLEKFHSSFLLPVVESVTDPCPLVPFHISGNIRQWVAELQDIAVDTWAMQRGLDIPSGSAILMAFSEGAACFRHGLVERAGVWLSDPLYLLAGLLDRRAHHRVATAAAMVKEWAQLRPRAVAVHKVLGNDMFWSVLPHIANGSESDLPMEFQKPVFLEFYGKKLQSMLAEQTMSVLKAHSRRALNASIPHHMRHIRRTKNGIYLYRNMVADGGVARAYWEEGEKAFVEEKKKKKVAKKVREEARKK